MDKDNFYLLLGISVDPPENDPKIIELAIKKKQAEWSRLRNHPSKGIKAQKYIGLLSEIRRIMTDADLRQKEAKNAKKIIDSSTNEKLAEIDRHLTLRMSKGYITDNEIFKLAKIHSIKIDQLRSIIKKKEEEKLSKIDQQLKLRTEKGYITKEEIVKLAEINSVKEKEIRKRIKCPIKKGKKKQPNKQKALDKAIEKIIKDNLKIVDRSTLYEFLGTPPESGLETLQKKTKEKGIELRNTGKKDAMTTASIILSGQCSTVFKTEKSRFSYDISLAGIAMKDLNSDIDIAGMDGIIKAEYFDALVQTAIESGLDEGGARDYITKYCKKNKWKIEFKKRIPVWTLCAAAIGLIITACAGAVFFVHINKIEKIEIAYKKISAQVESQEDIKTKLKILQDFVISHPESRLSEEAKKKIEKYQFSLDKRVFAELINESEKFKAGGNYQNALILLKKHLNKFPKSSHAGEIRQKIDKIASIIDDKDIKAARNSAQKDITSRINAYSEYLKKHPLGKYAEDVKKILTSMNEEYYIFLKKKITAYEKQEDWAQGILLCNAYLEEYKNTKRSVELKAMLDSFRNKLWEKETFDRLVEKTKEYGTDYESAKQIYFDYLQAYPYSYVNEKINNEIEKLDKNIEIRRVENKIKKIKNLIGKADKRFINNNNGTIKDTKTGLIWGLIDSLLDIGNCIEYDEATAYVNKIKTGGYTDWRLPTVEELGSIYKNKPFFPQGEAEWYWTSKSYSRYSEGWCKVVDIVTSTNELSWVKEQKDSRDCGSVMAVRP